MRKKRFLYKKPVCIMFYWFYMYKKQDFYIFT